MPTGAAKRGDCVKCIPFPLAVRTAPVSQMEPDRLTAYNPETQFKYRFDLTFQLVQATLYGKYVKNFM
jgi:hypothetical protein